MTEVSRKRSLADLHKRCNSPYSGRMLSGNLSGGITGRGFDLVVDGVAVRPRGIIHAGGHHGEEVSLYERFGVRRVVWFEADPDAFVVLRNRVGERTGHHCIEVLLTDGREDGKRLFYRNRIGEASEKRAFCSVFPLDRDHPAAVIPHLQTFEEVEMATSTIAREMRRRELAPEDFDYVSLNIQGAELLALQGMAEYLDPIRWIYCDVETGRSRYIGAPLDTEIEAWLGERGFKRAGTGFFYRR